MSRAKWKNPHTKQVLRNTTKTNNVLPIERNYEITPHIVGKTYKVYNGKMFVKFLITDEMIGHKVGEFVPTRVKFIFKKKTKKQIESMGQKVNPTIFRLGINKTWNTEFYENKNSELQLYTFKNTEIKSYIQKFLLDNGLLLHSYKIHNSQGAINIYISYFVPTTFKFNKNKKIKTIDQLNNTLQISKLTEGLNIFLGKNHKIVIIFQCINKNLWFLTRKQINFLKTRLTLLGQFRNKENFNFDETFDIILNSVFNKNSSFMLSNFISKKLKKIKKHNRFLSCIKQILELLVFSNFSKIKGIKIKIAGKLNRARRKKNTVIKIGDIPTQTINTSLDYSQTTITHNPNGSLGIKIWIIEK